MGSSSKFQTPKKSATESSRVSALCDSTPAKLDPQSETPEANEADRVERRKWLCDLLRGHGKDIGFDKLLAMLNISEERLGQFINKFSDVFTAVALRCPAYVGKKLRQPRTNMTQVLKLLTSEEDAVQELREDLHIELDNSIKGEAALVPYFLQLLGMIQESRSMQPADDKLLWPSQDYAAAEHQTKPLLGGVHKIDCAVHFKSQGCRKLNSVHIPIEAKTSSHTGQLNDEVFGQLADYAHALWGCQPTRVFVPALLLHATEMTLVVFTRDKWYKCDIGGFCYSTKAPTVYDVESLRSSLIKLAFLLTLPPQEFGHFCDVSVGSPTWLRFTSLATELTDQTMWRRASVVRKASAGEGVVHLDEGQRIERRCYPRGRLVFLYRMKVAEKDAVLKLVWTPVHCLPEPAVYQVLHGAGLDRIPKIYDQGILAKDTFGYRVDYLVVEDVGDAPDADLQRYPSESGEWRCDRAVALVSQVIETLADAKKAGVLHRDVSVGSIAVRGDRVSLIDWECAKLLAEDVDPAAIENLAATWEFDAGAVLGNEDKHDPLTGTMKYTSIPVLVGAKTRGIVDDVESVFYVLLDVVRGIQPPLQSAEDAKPPPAMNDVDGPLLALARGGCFTVRNRYLPVFGVWEASDGFREVADILYNYLFMHDGKCISCLLALDSGYKREPDVDALLASIYDVLSRLRDPATAPLSRDSGSATLGAGAAALQHRDAGRATQPRAESSTALLRQTLNDNVDNLPSMDDGAPRLSNVAASASPSKRRWDDATAEDADGPAGATMLAGTRQPSHSQPRGSKRIKDMLRLSGTRAYRRQEISAMQTADRPGHHPRTLRPRNARPNRPCPGPTPKHNAE